VLASAHKDECLQEKPVISSSHPNHTHTDTITITHTHTPQHTHTHTTHTTDHPKRDRTHARTDTPPHVHTLSGLVLTTLVWSDFVLHVLFVCISAVCFCLHFDILVLFHVLTLPLTCQMARPVIVGFPPFFFYSPVSL